MDRFAIRRFAAAMSFLGLLGVWHQAEASAFQLWEQDAGTVGEYHGGYAAKAEDATTSFYNPAGITRIKNQQAVFGGNAIMPAFKYKGSISISTINAGQTAYPVTTQGGEFAFVPFLHYVAPISDMFSFGFSVDAPFGLKTNYGYNSFIRYAATLSAVTVVDISPVLAMQINDQFSFGIGPDIQRMFGEFDQVGTISDPANDTPGINKANDTAYGYHAGILYQFSPDTRVGLSYHSQVVHHLTGTSRFIGVLSDLTGGPLVANRLNGRVSLPPYTALSVYHRFNPCFALMGSAIYTQWNIFKNLIFNNVAGLDANGPSTTIQVNIPQHYRSTWNLALGANYNLNEYALFRAGLGFDESPATDRYRNIQLPDNNRYVITLGGHYQITKSVGADLSWLHVFVKKTHVNPVPQVTGAQTTITDGNVMGGADVIGAQLVWDM